MPGSMIHQLRRVLHPGDRIAVGPGCGTPTSLLRAIAACSDPQDPVELWSGLTLGPFPVDAVVAGAIQYRTWHLTSETRALVDDGVAAFHPLRASEVAKRLLERGIEVAVVRVSPPDRHGYVSLGTSVSFTRELVLGARLVLGEVDEEMPRTCGMSMIHRSIFDLLLPSEDPTPIYHEREVGSEARRIAAHLLPLLPSEPALQMGIGEVPEAVTSLLAEAGARPTRIIGMATDATIRLFEAGALSPQAVVPNPAVTAVELMGSGTLLEYVDGNAAVGVYPASVVGRSRVLSASSRFVSINSAIEVDLLGQASAEWANGRQISGIGGSIDFSEGAAGSEGGLRILALPATRGDRTRIVGRLLKGTPVSVTRNMVDFIVTEHGVADLRGASTRERAERLIAIADPAYQDQLLTSAITDGLLDKTNEADRPLTPIIH